MDMTYDALREVLSALTEAWQAAMDAGYEPEVEAAIVRCLDTAMTETEDALRMAVVPEDE